MKYFITMISFLSLLSSCNSSTPPRDHQPMQKEEEVDPRDASETNSFTKDREIPDVIQK